MSLLRSFSLVALLSAVAAPAFATTYTVDPSHSRVGFSVTHMTVSTVRGEFGTFSGTVDWDAKNVAATKVSGKVSVASVDTREPKRDEHLKSADFFDASKYTEMSFTSKSVKNITSSGFDLVGDLTIHGVTKEVTFKVNTLATEIKDPWGAYRSGTHATTVINRKDFGLTYGGTLDSGGYVVGDEVTIELDLELTRS